MTASRYILKLGQLYPKVRHDRHTQISITSVVHMKAIPSRVQKLSNYMCPTHRQDDDVVHKVEAVVRSTYPSSMSLGHEEGHCRSMKVNHGACPMK